MVRGSQMQKNDDFFVAKKYGFAIVDSFNWYWWYMWFPLDTIVAWAKRRWFVYPGSDIYGWLANAWDYGPYGSVLKKNIADARWKFFVQQRDDMVGMDSQILMHPRVWEASGHVGNFNDPMIDDKKTGERFRADKLIETRIEGNFPPNVKEAYYKLNEERNAIAHSIYWKEKSENEGVFSEMEKTETAMKKVLSDWLWFDIPNVIPESRWFDVMREFIKKFIPNNPNSKKHDKADRTDVRKFNMMFSTHQGVIENDESKVWLRPETAQGIFVNFRNVTDTTRMRVPFGIAQIGKAFRNEITPGQFLYRTREFEQMEIEYFVENDHDKAMERFEDWKSASQEFWKDVVWLKAENLKFREHEKDELAHYSAGTFDVEYQFPWGWGELQGLAYRTDFDLKQHMEFSGKDMQYTDPYSGKRYVPHVIEPSFGLSRTVLVTMLDAYDEEKYTNGKWEEETRTVARFHKTIAPIKFCVIPLLKKDPKMVGMAEDIYRKLSKDYMCEFDDSGNIGKCYRRQDEIGTPYCITVDHQSLEDNTVTIRDRDTMAQERISISDIKL